MIKQVNEAEFANITAKGAVVADFNATWCGPCRMLGPVLEELSEETSNVTFIGVDVDECAELAGQYGINSVPCVLFLKDGKEVSRSIGFKPKAAMAAWVAQNA